MLTSSREIYAVVCCPPNWKGLLLDERRLDLRAVAGLVLAVWNPTIRPMEDKIPPDCGLGAGAALPASSSSLPESAFTVTVGVLNRV